MEREKTFQDNLEELLKVRGVDANPNQRQTLAIARELERIFDVKGDRIVLSLALTQAAVDDRKARAFYNEHFIIAPLSSDMTLYTPTDLIKAAKDFYAGRGLKVKDHLVRLKGYEEVLTFEGEKKKEIVQFDFGPGFRPDENSELWVTTFSLIQKSN